MLKDRGNSDNQMDGDTFRVIMGVEPYNSLIINEKELRLVALLGVSPSCSENGSIV